jgi:5'-nucleotidase
MKTILLSNDDGIQARGLWALEEQLSEGYRVYVVAPDRERSATGHSISLHDPIRVKEVEQGRVYAVSGTPVDAVHVALLGLIKEPIDLVVTGINYGLNLGSDVFYSGTVSAAFQAVSFDVPGLAVSIGIEGDEVQYRTAAAYVEKVLNKIENNRVDSKIVLNMNVPNTGLERIRGVQITRLGDRLYDDKLVEREDPRKNKYFWIDGAIVPGAPEEGTDVTAVEQGYVSLTPLQKDITARDFIGKLREWEFDRIS